MQKLPPGKSQLSIDQDASIESASDAKQQELSELGADVSPHAE